MHWQAAKDITDKKMTGSGLGQSSPRQPEEGGGSRATMLTRTREDEGLH